MNKKVGFLIMNFESGGGTERVTSVIANELVKKNFDVRIISCFINIDKMCHIM